MPSFSRFLFLRLAVLSAFFGLNHSSAFAQATVCARVEIQIEQELTFEREGFEARLSINNGTPVTLTDLAVVLKFSDENGNPVSVTTDSGNTDPAKKFFYRPSYPIVPVTSVNAGASADLAFLIVPSPGAALDKDGQETSTGRLYYIGATVTYRSSGQDQIVEIAPDYITVRPMPDLRLQYFLPGTVYGDDPDTPTEHETPIPFPMGVRVINNSTQATARKLKIQSGQPQITANELGLLVKFQILSGEVNDQPAQPDLLVSLGDVAPQHSSVAAWMMTSSLTGGFISFQGEVAHAPEFGGALTSLIRPENISTYRLLGRVQTDSPGRDTIRDFLATSSMTDEISSETVVTLHESDTAASAVPVPLAIRTASPLTGGSQSTLAVGPVSTATLYVRAPSPILEGAAAKLVVAVRSDGKKLPPANVWISRTRDGNHNDVYTLNLFDTFESTLPNVSYSLTFLDSNQAPLVVLSRGGNIAGATVLIRPGSPLAITATATDPDGPVPALTSGILPDGANFVIQSAIGQGLFTWTPGSDITGTYVIQFRATDARGYMTRRTLRIVVDPNAAIGFDSWLASYGLTGSSAGADPDLDGFDNLLEYALNGNPTKPDDSIMPSIGLIEVSGSSYLVLTYRHRTDDPSLVFTVVGSTNALAPLSAWTGSTVVVSTGETDPETGLREVRVRDTVPLQPGEPQRYLRLRVSRQ